MKNARVNQLLTWIEEHQTAAVAVLMGCILLWNAVSRMARVTRLQAAQDGEFARLEEQLATREKELQERYAARLADQDLISGETARRAHDAEWERRVAHEPKLARSNLEKAILKMESIAGSANFSDKEVLEQVANLSAPTGSSIKVEEGKAGYRISVAFRLSATTQHEAGATTKHHTVDAMREEVVEICSRVMRDLYDHCGRRGIESIRLSCNHAARSIPAGTPLAEVQAAYAKAPVTWSVFYRCTIPQERAAAIPKWRNLALHTVSDMFVAEDLFSTLTINSFPGIRSEAVDPTGPPGF